MNKNNLIKKSRIVYLLVLLCFITRAYPRENQKFIKETDMARLVTKVVALEVKYKKMMFEYEILSVEGNADSGRNIILKNYESVLNCDIGYKKIPVKWLSFNIL